MPYDGAGNYGLPVGSTATDGEDIVAPTHNIPIEDIAAALNQAFLRSGLVPMTGDLNMNGNAIIGLAAATDPSDPVRLDQAILKNSGTGTQTITATGLAPLLIESVEAGAAIGPNLGLYRNSATPAVNDVLGGVTFYGKDSLGNMTGYGHMYAAILDPTNGSEDGRLVFGVTTAGGSVDELLLQGDALAPAANGALSLGANGFRFLNAWILRLESSEGGVLGDAAVDPVTIKGTLVNSYSSGLLNNANSQEWRSDLSLLFTFEGGGVPHVSLGNTFTAGQAIVVPSGALGGQPVLALRRDEPYSGSQVKVLAVRDWTNADIASITMYPSTTPSDGAATWNGYVNSPSDLRLKEDIVNLDADEALAALRLTRPVTYVRKGQTAREAGFLAQELYAAIPDAAQQGSGEPGAEGSTPWGVRLGQLEPRIIAVLLGMAERIEALETKVAELSPA